MLERGFDVEVVPGRVVGDLLSLMGHASKRYLSRQRHIIHYSLTCVGAEDRLPRALMQFEVCTLTAIRKQYRNGAETRAISTITNQLRREPASLTLRAKLGRLITQTGG